MRYRLLHRAQINLSEISFGGMSLGDNHKENADLLQAAFDGGINYFDTADIYQNGFNEETVGKGIWPFRKHIFLATKVGNEPKSNGTGWNWNPSKSYILKAVEGSLKRLQTDYIDLYQLHGGTIEDKREEVLEAFQVLKQEGKILHYGISSIRPNVVREYVAQSSIVSDMLQYSLLDRRPEELLLKLLSENGIGVLVRGALAKGLLAYKDSSDYLDYTIQDVELLRDKLNSFSIEKMTNSQVALKWVLANPAVTSVVLGIRTKAQLKDALAIHDSRNLTSDEVSQLAEILKPNFYSAHR